MIVPLAFMYLRRHRIRLSVRWSLRLRWKQVLKFLDMNDRVHVVLLEDHLSRWIVFMIQGAGQPQNTRRFGSSHIPTEIDGEASEYGKFGWVMDPEGNKVELWQPPPGS